MSVATLTVDAQVWLTALEFQLFFLDVRPIGLACPTADSEVGLSQPFWIQALTQKRALDSRLMRPRLPAGGSSGSGGLGYEAGSGSGSGVASGGAFIGSELGCSTGAADTAATPPGKGKFQADREKQEKRKAFFKKLVKTDLCCQMHCSLHCERQVPKQCVGDAKDKREYHSR
jgi:hypothetical protein